MVELLRLNDGNNQNGDIPIIPSNQVSWSMLLTFMKLIHGVDFSYDCRFAKVIEIALSEKKISLFAVGQTIALQKAAKNLGKLRICST